MEGYVCVYVCVCRWRKYYPKYLFHLCSSGEVAAVVEMVRGLAMLTPVIKKKEGREGRREGER